MGIQHRQRLVEVFHRFLEFSVRQPRLAAITLLLLGVLGFDWCQFRDVSKTKLAGLHLPTLIAIFDLDQFSNIRV